MYNSYRVRAIFLSLFLIVTLVDVVFAYWPSFNSNTMNTNEYLGESPKLTNCFKQLAQANFENESIVYCLSTEKHLVVLSVYPSLMNKNIKEPKEYRIRCLLPKTLQTNWQLLDINTYPMINLFDSFMVLAKGKTLEWISLENAKSIKIIEHDEDITSLGSSNSKLFVTTASKILVYSESRTLHKEIKSDNLRITASDDTSIVLINKDKHIACMDTFTPNIKWKYTGLFNKFDVIIAGDRIITSTINNELLILEKESGRVILKRKFDKDYLLLNSSYMSFSNDRIIINNKGKDIYCLNVNTGGVVWQYNSTVLYSINSWATIISNRIYFPNHKLNQLLCLDFITGNTISKSSFSNSLQNLITMFHDEHYYFYNSDDKGSTLHCYKFTIPQNLTYNLDKTIFTGQNVEYYMDVKPTIVNGSTYMPAKYVLEPLGGEVSWSQKDKKVTCILKNDTKNVSLEMKINNPQATLNGKQVQIDPKNPKITPIIINGRTMVPLRFLAESLGCKVEWKPDTKEIIVTYQP